MRGLSTFVLMVSITLPVNAFAQDVSRSTSSPASPLAQNFVTVQKNCGSQTAHEQRGAVGQLSDIKGNVLVSQGKGFSLASEPLELRVGDRVLLSEGSQARLDIGKQSRQLMPQSMITIIEGEDCVYAAAEEKTTVEVYRGDSSAQVYGADLPEFVPPPAEPVAVTPVEEPFPLLPVLLGGAALIGIGALILADDDDVNRRNRRRFCERIEVSPTGGERREFERVCDFF